MKLCFLAGANSIHSFRWIKFFAQKKHQVHWISLTSNQFSEIEGVNFYKLKNPGIKFLDILLNIVALKRLVRIIRPDVLHAHYAGVNGLLGALSGFHPFVLTAWGSDVLITAKSKIVKPLIKFALKKADLITCDAEHMKKALIGLDTPASKIKIVYFGIDTQKFSPGIKNSELIRELELQNSPAIISLRNLEPVYNIETLIKAIPLVLKEFPEAKFIIAGKGSEEKKLKEMAKTLRISENIRFIGFISNEELPQYLRMADVYISTSLSDAGISSCTAEAMSCGLPVVITNTGENEKWIKNGENGFLIPVKEPQILALKIIFLLKNNDDRIIFGKKARKIIEEKNDYFKEMAKMSEFYKEIYGKI